MSTFTEHKDIASIDMAQSVDYEVDDLLLDTATDLFSGTCTFDAVQAAESGGWAPAAWDAVAEAGFAWIGIDEKAGGSGGTLADAAEVLRIAGAHAAPIPLAETGMLGGWLLAQAGLPIPSGPVTVAPGTPDDAASADMGAGGLVLSGMFHRVPWAAQADRLVILLGADSAQSIVASIDTKQLKITSVPNLAGEPRDSVELDRITVEASDMAIVTVPNLGEQLRLRGALSRTMLMAGALEAMSQLTVGYTNDRLQFGRPIAKFQAVQQHLVWGAQDAAITKIAAQQAAAAASSVADINEARFQIAAARTLANDAAQTATRWAHQAHGAMGMTQEYALHHLSRRLWAWRHEWSTPNEWPRLVGEIAERHTNGHLYPLVTL